MTAPNVSVIIPTYNREILIKDAINSVLVQTFQDFEIVVIDDGSTDNTKNVVESYNDSRIKYFYQQNAGLNAARNAGIRESCGKYIAYLDSDDIWESVKLEKQVKILEKFPEIGLVYCGSSLIDENNKNIGKRPLISYKGNVFDKIIRYNFLYNGSIVLFRRECLEKVGLFDEHTVRMTDWEFYLRFAIYYNFYGIPEYLIRYRVHNQTMTNDFKLFENSGFQIIDKTFAISDIDKKHMKLKKTAYAMRYRYLGRRYFDNNLMFESREYFKKAIDCDFSILFSTDSIGFYMMSYFPLFITEGLRDIKKQLKFLSFASYFPAQK